MSYKKEIELQRASKDQQFKRSHQSPISHKLRDEFVALDYYPIDENYVFKLPLVRYDNPKTIQMETSDGDIRDYFRIGYLEFNLEDSLTKIHVYQASSNPDHYFVPYRDKTSGFETYGAGKYMDIEKDGQVFILDFNKAYSPYCAYNVNYSCPLPPFENHLKVSILAGEKNFPLDIF